MVVRRIKNEAPRVYMGRCPKILWITGFPFGVYKHGPPDRKRKRFEGFARNDDTGEPNVS